MGDCALDVGFAGDVAGEGFEFLGGVVGDGEGGEDGVDAGEGGGEEGVGEVGHEDGGAFAEKEDGCFEADAAGGGSVRSDMWNEK